MLPYDSAADDPAGWGRAYLARELSAGTRPESCLARLESSEAPPRPMTIPSLDYDQSVFINCPFDGSYKPLAATGTRS